MFEDILTMKDILLIVSGAIVVIAMFIVDKIIRRAVPDIRKRLNWKNMSRTFSN